MPVLSLPFTDLVTLLQACRAVRPRDCTPDHLRDLIACRLDPTLRQLADRVRAFDKDQMVALCEYVLTGLELAEGSISEHG